jgi:predicted PurR-regulated permease PerM
VDEDQPPPQGTRGSFRSVAADAALRRLIVASSLRVVLGILGIGIGALLAWRLRLLLLLVAVAFFIALLLQPFVHLLEKRGLRRSASVALVYLVLIALAGSFGYLMFHPLYTSATRFATDLPSLVRQAQHGKGQVGRLITRLHLASWVQQHAPALENAITKIGKPALAVGKTVLSGVVGLVTIVFLSLFMLLEGPKIFFTMMTWLTERQAAAARRVISRMTHEISGFMLGDFATSVVAGVVVYVALRLTGVPFASVLAIWAGFIDFLPLVGGLLAGVPAVGVGFLHSVTAGLVTAVVFLVYQQIENHVLYPIIVSKTVRLNPLLVLLAVLFGAELGDIFASTFGAICGAIFAVPAAGVLQLSALDLLQERIQHRQQAAVDE